MHSSLVNVVLVVFVIVKMMKGQELVREPRSKLTGNKINYGDPHCARRLGQDMELGISHLVFIVAGANGYSENETEDLAAQVGAVVRKAAETSAKAETESINPSIQEAISSVKVKPELNLNELSTVVVWNGLRKLCIEENCCYNY